jgi:hypothetical protein
MIGIGGLFEQFPNFCVSGGRAFHGRWIRV